MKNCFDTGKKWLGRGLLLAALAGATVAPSCSDEYDDSAIIDRIDELEERLGKLETKLNNDIKALQDLLENKQTISSATKADGVWTIVLSGGETITVAEVSDNPLISVVEEEGAYYWTLDGEKLLVDGKPVAVSGATPSLKVDPTTKEWMISPDGGKTWMGTGIIGENASLFKKVEADDNNVYFTLADGTELKIAKKGGESTFNLRFLVGKQYFDAGQKKTVEIDLTGVKKATVVGKPDGWKASLNEGKLTITAPASTDTGAEKQGTIAILAVSDEGKSDIGELAVVQGVAYFNLSASGEAVTLKHKFDPDYWNYGGDYNGVMKFNDFSVEAIERLLEDTSRLQEDATGYANKPIAELLTAQGLEVEKGVSYVVWAVPILQGEPKISDMQYVVVTTMNMEFSATASFEDPQIKIAAKGVSKYMGGVSRKADFDLANMIENINYFGASESGYAVVKGNYEGPLSRYAMMWNSPNTLKPGQEYVVWALPMSDDNGHQYTAEECYHWDVKLADITLGGTAAVTIGEVDAKLKSVSATITPGEGAYKFYCDYISDADMTANYDTDEKLLAFLSTKIGQTAEYKLNKTGLTPETKGWIAAVAVNAEGKAGAIQKVEANTPAISFSTTIVTCELVAGNSHAYAKPTAKGGEIAKYVYYYKEKSAFEMDYLYQGDVKKLEAAMIDMFETQQYGYYAITPDAIPEEGIKIPAPNTWPSTLTNGVEHIVAVMGFDASGLPAHLYTGYVTPEVELAGKIIKSNSSDYTKDMPKITRVEWDGSKGNGYVRGTIELPAGCQKCYLHTDDRETMGSATDVLKQTRTVVGSGKEITESGSFTGNKYMPKQNAVFYIVWIDSDGNTHVVYDMQIFPGNYLTTTDGMPTATVDGTKWTVDLNGNKKCYLLATDSPAADPYLLTAQVMRDGKDSDTTVTVAEGQKLYAVWVDADNNTHQAAEITL